MRCFADNIWGDCMKKLAKNSVFFTVGSIGYGTIEVIWRGYTHWTMLVAGGICSVIFSRIADVFRYRSRTLKASFCALSVTGVELIFGIIFNVILKKNIWDYSKMPMNFLGQICPLYTFLWGVLGFVCMPVADSMNQKLKVCSSK